MSSDKKATRNPVDIRRLLSLAIPHWKTLTVATIALFLGAALSLLYPQAARLTVDDFVGPGSAYDVRSVAFVVLILFLAQSFFVSLRYYLFTVVGDRVVTDLRKDLYAAVLNQEIGFFDETSTGELTSRLNSDTAVLQSTVTSNLSMALRFTTQAIGGVIVLFLTSVKLASVMIIAVPTVVLMAVYVGRQLRKLSRRVQDKLAEATSVAEESIAGVRTVRSFSREPDEVERYGAAVEDSFQTAKKRARIGALFNGTTSFFGYSTIGVILWYGAILVGEKAMTPGELTAFVLYTLMVAVSIGTLSSLWGDFMRATGSAERVFELLDRRPEIMAAENAVTPPVVGKIDVDSLTFAYPTRPEVNALQHVSFGIDAGQKIAFVGPSGSGKSTVANLILRFYDPQEGAVRIDGVDIREFDPDYLREQIGVVAQEPILFSGSVRQNVLYGRPDAKPDEVIEALKAANAWDFVSSFPDAMETLIGERGVRLSGGQKQRIAIARAILKDPRILVLDEATSALDVESEALVQQALERLMESRTTLIIAHRLSTVAVADIIVVIDRGRVVEQGSHDQLIAEEGVYHRLIHSQRLSDTSVFS